MKAGESLQRPSESITADMLGSFHLLNMPLEDRVALGVAKARQRRGQPRKDAFAEVERLKMWGESIYAPRGSLFSIRSADETFSVTYMSNTSSNEYGYSLEPLLVGSASGAESAVFIADRIMANPKTSQDPGAPYAYSPYYPYQRVRVVDGKYTVDLIDENEIPEEALNPAPPKENWLRYSNPWD